MNKVQGLITIDGEEFVSITIEVDSEKSANILATEMGAGMSGGVTVAYTKYIVGDFAAPQN
jgi:hypothetical protein